jgi:hypothetical protein
MTNSQLLHRVADPIKAKHNQGFEAMAQAAIDVVRAEVNAGLLEALEEALNLGKRTVFPAASVG